MPSKIPVLEIFGPTIQGEGRVIGRKTMFVRTAGCDYRCSWCDSAFTWDGSAKDDIELLTAQEIYERLKEIGGNQFDHVTISGGNPELITVFQDLIDCKTVQWIIDNNRLAPFKYYSVNLMDNDKLKKNSTGDFSDASITLSMEPQIYGDVIKNYKKFADGQKTIVYTHNVQSSKEVAEKFISNGYAAKQVDGKTPKVEREKAMELFRSGDITILVNAELYGEGVDVPDCECVILLRPTMSLTLFIQQTMRSMRYQPNKLATIIDHVGNYRRHGLPNTEHDWNVHFKGERKKSKDNDAIPIKECPECYSVIESSYSVCPACGFEFPQEREETELLIDEDAELEEVDDKIITLTLKEPEECESVEELYQLAKQKGYKPGWAYIQAKRLGMLGG